MSGIRAGEADLIGILQEIIPLEFNSLLFFLQKLDYYVLKLENISFFSVKFGKE